MLKNYPIAFVYIKQSSHFFSSKCKLIFFSKKVDFEEWTVYDILKMLKCLIFKCLKENYFGSKDLYTWGDIKHESKLCVMMHTWNPSTWEAEAGGSQIWGQQELV